jgi:hypothetical protein
LASLVAGEQKQSKKRSKKKGARSLDAAAFLRAYEEENSASAHAGLDALAPGQVAAAAGGLLEHTDEDIAAQAREALTTWCWVSPGASQELFETRDAGTKDFVAGLPLPLLLAHSAHLPAAAATRLFASATCRPLDRRLALSIAVRACPHKNHFAYLTGLTLPLRPAK